MNDSAITVVQRIVRRENRSLLQYVREAYPWARANAQGIINELDRLITEEAKSTAALVTFLVRRLHGTLPYFGSFPDFTCLNFVTLDYLLARLVDAQRQSIAALEQDLAALSDAETRQQVENVLETKRRLLKKLEELAVPVPA